MKSRWDDCRLVAFLLVLGLALRVWIVLQPITESFRLSVPDDAYYYFTIAHNLATGFGATSDHLSPTNGFHPLWLLSLTPFWFLEPSTSTIPVQLALTASALLSTCAALMLYRLARELVSTPSLAILAMAFYLFNPFGLALSVDGMETSLAILLFGIALQFVQKLTASLKRDARWFNAGLVWGLLLVARTDYVFIVAGFVFQTAWHWRSAKKTPMRWVALISGLSLPVLPWAAWNAVTFRTIAQVSSEAYPYYRHTLWFAEHGADWTVLAGWEAKLLFDAILALSRYLSFGRWFVLAALGIGIALRLTATQYRTRIMLRLAPVTLLALATLLYHALYRWTLQPWYVAPLVFLAPLWIAVAMDALKQQRAVPAILTACALLIAFDANAGLDLSRNGGVYPSQIESLDRDFCGGLDRIGESDSGFSMYYAPCTIVNLDGVVNNKAFEAIKGGHFASYLDEIRLRHVALNSTISELVRLQEGAIADAPPWK